MNKGPVARPVLHLKMEKRPTDKKLESMISEAGEAKDIDCTEDIMDCIESGTAEMKSRWLVFTQYFGLRTAWVLVVFALVGLINLNLFIFSRGPQWEFIEFGSSSLGIVAKHFPYGWAALAMALLMFAAIAMRKFSFSYRWPFRAFVLLLVGGVFVSGSVAFSTGINDALYKKLVEDPGAHDSLLAKLYCLAANRRLESQNALIGEVMYAGHSNMVIQTPNLEVVTVLSNEDTHWLDAEPVERFEVIKMIGSRDGDVFVASLVKKDDDDLKINRDLDDCVDGDKLEQKHQIAEKRREAVRVPMTPVVGTAQFIKSIY